MAKIIISHYLPHDDFAELKAHDLIIPGPYCEFSQEELARLIPEADAIVACGKLPGDTIRKGRKLKIIANYGAGYDSVDIKTAAECGIPVTNIPDAVAASTAELAIALMMAVSRRVGEMNLLVRGENSRDLFRLGKYLGRNLFTQTLGIIGCGKIGSKVAQTAKALGMRVIAYNRRGCDPDIAEPVDLDTLLETADIVSLHCPLTDETRGLIGSSAFARMKKGAMIINTARGAVIDFDALVDALDSGHISGAGIDVYPDEPNIPEGLLRHPNAVCTPHIGSNTVQTRREMGRACSERILAALAGRRPDNIVNGL
ncbi:MAG: hypothetical protein IJA26_05085 [Clostridia bacterium]|nr:hypothetical protein [Clostridia bacterium]